MLPFAFVNKSLNLIVKHNVVHPKINDRMKDDNDRWLKWMIEKEDEWKEIRMMNNIKMTMITAMIEENDKWMINDKFDEW